MSYPITQSGAGGADEQAPSTDDLFEVLSDERRAVVVAILEDRSKPMGVEALASEVAARESQAGATVDEEDRQQVHVSLHHIHLPKMADHGVVTYDRADGTVTLDVTLE